MDWNLAIERNTEALKRILAMLVAMAELGGQFTFFPRKGALPQGSTLAEKSKLSPAFTLLRLLRPAESAVRRLIIVAARSVVVSPPPPRSAWSPSPVPSTSSGGGGSGSCRIHRFGSSPAKRGRGTAKGGGGGTATVSGGGEGMATRPLALPLFDQLPRWHIRPRRPAPSSMPRISVPGYTVPFAIVPRRLPSPDDPVDATRLGRRVATLSAVLDDLPRQANRFARWRARRDAIIAQERNHDTVAAQTGEPRRRSKPQRIWPLRPGRPPGQHPRRGRKKSRHEVHEILKDLHGLAFDVLEERRDTS